MTDREIMQQALDALKNGKQVRAGERRTNYQPELEDAAIAALEAALAQPEQDWDLLAATQASLREHMARIKELEAQRQWVGLTDDEIEKIVDLNTLDDGGFDIWCDGIAVSHIVCAKLKEKNT